MENRGFFSLLSKYRGKICIEKTYDSNKQVNNFLSLYFCVCGFPVAGLPKLSTFSLSSSVWKFESSPLLPHDSFSRPLLPLNNPSTHIKWYFFPPSCVSKIIAHTTRSEKEERAKKKAKERNIKRNEKQSKQ